MMRLLFANVYFSFSKMGQATSKSNCVGVDQTSNVELNEYYKGDDYKELQYCFATRVL